MTDTADQTIPELPIGYNLALIYDIADGWKCLVHNAITNTGHEGVGSSARSAVLMALNKIKEVA